MRIQGREAVLQAYVSRVAEGRTGQVGRSTPTIGQEDRVTLSRSAQDIRKVKEHLANLPEVRESRVKELRQRIERGEYHVSEEELADRILESGVLDLPVDFLI
jgi:negative regulator of flagellin synthesis FlgM